MPENTGKSSSERWDVQIKRAMDGHQSATTKPAAPATDGKDAGGPLSMFPHDAADQYVAAHPAHDLPGQLELMLWRAQPLIIGLTCIVLAIILLLAFARFWPPFQRHVSAFFEDRRTPPKM